MKLRKDFEIQPTNRLEVFIRGLFHGPEIQKRVTKDFQSGNLGYVYVRRRADEVVAFALDMVLSGFLICANETSEHFIRRYSFAKAPTDFSRAHAFARRMVAKNLRELNRKKRLAEKEDATNSVYWALVKLGRWIKRNCRPVPASSNVPMKIPKSSEERAALRAKHEAKTRKKHQDWLAKHRNKGEIA